MMKKSHWKRHTNSLLLLAVFVSSTLLSCGPRLTAVDCRKDSLSFIPRLLNLSIGSERQ
jgi:hypothetical protein